jgi:hypothetical protein
MSIFEIIGIITVVLMLVVFGLLVWASGDRNLKPLKTWLER